MQTAQLDGETSLKVRATPKHGRLQVCERFAKEEAFFDWNGFVRCEEPSAELDKFSGMLYMREGDRVGIDLGSENVLLRVSLFQ